ncbi:hypothetical protein KR018_009908, partial [Drosophila ironensis]
MTFFTIDVCDFNAYRDALKMVEDCEDFVDHLMVAEYLPHTHQVAYINVRTQEQVVYCVELSHCGYRIVGYDFDIASEDVADCDTIYPSAHLLLAGISPLYSQEFGYGREPLKQRDRARL